MKYYEVAPTKIIRANSASFTYSCQKSLPIGSIVEIEIGKKILPGIVLKSVEKPDYDTKSVGQPLEEQPLPIPLLKTALWMAEYYATPLATVLQTVLPRGLGKKRRPAVAEKPLRQSPEKISYTKDQQSAIKRLDDLKKGTVLLHGITGSGKTAVYIDQAKKTIQDGKSVILLVPEISLTAQLVGAFSAHFDNLYLTHSRQTEAQRHQIWRQVSAQTKPAVVIGPRSALFLPLQQIGLVIIDEMHEPSFKQEQSPRYSALRVASILTSAHQNAKLILGSATPPISEYYLADKTNQPIITMTNLARTDAIKPQVDVVDMTKRANLQRHRFFSNKLIVQIEKTLEHNEQVLIFHNRRGSANLTLCDNCGWSAACPRCFLPLTLHTDQHLLRCHVCNHTERVPTSCPECNGVNIFHKGIGTKLIESELRKLFPKHTIARFDADTTNDQTVDQQYHNLRDGQIDIIIGTQVIAKGLDLPHLRTVGVVQADAGLSLPDYSSVERTFQLLSQVVGRVGRSAHKTNVIIQSYQPEHPVVKLGMSQNYTDFYNYALSERQRSNFPPYTFLLKLTCVYKTEAAAIRNSRQLAATLRKNIAPTIEILGPTPAFYERQRDTYRWQLVLKSTRRADLVDALQHIPPAHWQYELDPTSLL